jgi:hypothetical protein
MICHVCLKSVNLACDIKTRCIETDRILREQLKIEPFSLFDEPEDFPECENKIFLPEIIVIEDIKAESIVDELDENNVDAAKLIGGPDGTQQRRSKVQDFRCFLCNKVFDKIAAKKKHVKIDHASELVCLICNVRKASPTATEKCLKDHKFGFDYLCQVFIAIKFDFSPQAFTSPSPIDLCKAVP